MSDAAFAWAAGIAWQAAVVAAVALAAELLLRGRAPWLRHGLWLLVLVRFVVPPSFAVAGSPAALLRGEADVAPPPASSAEWPVALWATGALVLAAGTLVRTLRDRRATELAAVTPSADVAASLARAARRMGFSRPPRLIVSEAVRGVALAGVWRPSVLVPSEMRAGAALDHALLHEMAHHRRRDLLVAAFATVVRCAFWWHPVAWLAAARLAALREICCDLDAAAALGPSAREYRTTLIDAARRLAAPAPRAALAWIGPGTALVARIEALSRPLPTRGRRFAGTCVVLAVGACALPLGAVAAAAGPAGVGLTPAEIATARDVLSTHAAGGERVSCFRLHYAAAALSAAAPATPVPAH